MEYSPQFEQAIRTLNPNATPDQVSMAYNTMKQQHPEGDDNAFVDAIMGAGVVTGKMRPDGLSQNAIQGVNEYQGLQQAQNTVKQKEQEMAQIDQGISSSTQNIQQMQQQFAQQPAQMGAEQYTSPQDLTDAQNRVQESRNGLGEKLGHVVAALGGRDVSANYNQFIAGKRRDENQEVQNVKDRMGAETHALRFQQAKDEYVETRRAMAQKNKEDRDRNDPNSQVSIITRGMFNTLAESNPALKNIPGVDKMSAAELAGYLPMAQKMAELAEKKIDADYKREKTLADIALSGARTSKAIAETNKINTQQTYTGGDDGSTISGIKVDKNGNRTLDPIVAKQMAGNQKGAAAASAFLKQIPEIEATLPKASQSGAGEILGNVQTFVGAGETGAANKRMSQFANSALGVIDSPLMKGAPSENDARRALSVINDPAAPLEVKQKAITQLKEILEESVASHNTALQQYDKETLQRLKGIGISSTSDTAPTAPAAGKKTVTMDYVKQQAAKYGSTNDEVIAHLKSKGYEVR